MTTEDAIKRLENDWFHALGGQLCVDECKKEAFLEAIDMAISALRGQQEAEKGCEQCSGIVYRQTNSGKIVPLEQRCGAKITPLCYQADGDGCAYQIYGDDNDEPIDRCKSCPLCYSDKTRHYKSKNEPLTLEELREMDGEPIWLHTFSAVQKKTNIAQWAILESVGNANAVFLRGGCNARLTKWFANYGKTWLAYRHKPEEETT